MTPDKTNTLRRRFLIISTAVVGSIGAVGVTAPFVASWSPNAKAKAQGTPIKVITSNTEPGQMVVMEWRDKPVYVVRRTPEMIGSLEKLTNQLKDPFSKHRQQPEYIAGITRSIDHKFLIVVGICTHLGGVPKYRPDVAPEDLGPEWLGGFFCPCHGSRFDLAGRVFKGVPAPTNLVIPPPMYENESIAIIGVDNPENLA